MHPFLAIFLALLPCLHAATTAEGLAWLEDNSKKDGVVTLPSGLQYKVVESGSGATPTASEKVECHYRGTTIDGTEFDSSYSRGSPATFSVNGVIKGWTEALQLMKEGDKWELYIPSELAYGDSQVGKHIKPGSVLIFHLELRQVRESTWMDYLTLSNMLLVVSVGWALRSFFGSGDVSGMEEIALASASSPSNPKVFMEVSVAGKSQGVMEFELFAKVVPKTAENFRALCTGEKQGGGKALAYKGSIFHRIIPNFMVQGGDFTHGNGTGGVSIYGAKFKDEFDNGYIKHSQPGLLSMANAGRDTNGSQFFITTVATPHLNGKHVVFGRITKGKDVLKIMEEHGSGSGRPKALVKIVDCGEVRTKSS